MSKVRDWMQDHGIDMTLAGSLGLYANPSDVLHVPYDEFERTRDFRREGSHFVQPKGEPLRLYWPLGRIVGGTVLLCEGEGDALAAASILADTEYESLNGLCPVGLPGVGAVKYAIPELSKQQVERVYIALDPDDAGQRASEALRELLPLVGIEPCPTDLAGGDLSEWLGKQACTREEALARLVDAAVPRPIHVTPKTPPKAFSGPTSDVNDIPPYLYYEKLTGRSSEGFEQMNVECPCPDHEDSTPSCKLWDNAEQGWFCYGCGRGGTIYDMAGYIWNMDTRGDSFTRIQNQLEEMFEAT